MLEKFVDDAAEKQVKRSKLDMASFEAKLVEEVAMEDTERGLKLEEFMSKTPKHAELYKSNYERLAKILAADQK